MTIGLQGDLDRGVDLAKRRRPLHLAIVAALVVALGGCGLPGWLTPKDEETIVTTPAPSETITGADALTAAEAILAEGGLTLPPSAEGVTVVVLNVPDDGLENLGTRTAPVTIIRFTALRTELEGMGEGYWFFPMGTLSSLTEYLLSSTQLPAEYDLGGGPIQPGRRMAEIVATQDEVSQVIVLSYRLPN